MDFLGNNLLFVTVRLEELHGDKAGVGTGFFYHHDGMLFVVTNKHVVEKVEDGSFLMLKSSHRKWEPILGRGVELSFSEKDFIGHPDPEIDIAVANISTAINYLKEKGNSPFWMHIDSSLIPDEEEIENFFSPVEEVYFVGYPNGIWDESNLLPIIRKGITATPYYVDFKNKKKFLIDASVFPGSSGSPVFIYYKGSYSDKYGNSYVGNKIKFIGVISKTYIHYSESINSNNIHSQMIDLGEVYKANTVQETIEHYIKITKINNGG